MTRYFLYLIACLVLFLALLATMNRLLDPYLIFNSQAEAWQGISRTFKLYARPHKAAQIDRVPPDLLVLGTSRAFDGLPMQDSALSDFSAPYNGALYDSTVAEMELLLKHAYCGGKLKQVVISLDFFTFNNSRPQFHQQNLRDYVRTKSCSKQKLEPIKRMLSLSSLEPLQLLKNQKMPYRYDIDTRGEVDDSILIVDRKNTLALIERSEKNYRELDGFYKDFSLSPASLGSLAAMLSFLQKNKIAAVLYISPIHARRLEVLDSVVGMTAFEDWKRHLVDINENIADEFSQLPFTLWDFTDYNQFVTEAIPKSYSKQPAMQYHWDTSHYRKSLGKLVWLKTLKNAELPVDFGSKLTSDNIESHLLMLRERRANWLAVASAL